MKRITIMVKEPEKKIPKVKDVTEDWMHHNIGFYLEDAMVGGATVIFPLTYEAEEPHLKSDGSPMLISGYVLRGSVIFANKNKGGFFSLTEKQMRMLFQACFITEVISA